MLTEHDRKILERIVEQGHCEGISCSNDVCPLLEFDCDQAEGTALMAKGMLYGGKARTQLTREDVEEICLEQIAEYLEKDEKPTEPAEQPKGIEQLFVKGSVWRWEKRGGLTEVLENVSDKHFLGKDGERLHKDDPSWQLIDTGKVPIADHQPPEGVPFMGFYVDDCFNMGFYCDDCFNDYMIEDGDWYVRPDGYTPMEKVNYTIKEVDTDKITHWQISGAMAVTAMQILRGDM